MSSTTNRSNHHQINVNGNNDDSEDTDEFNEDLIRVPLDGVVLPRQYKRKFETSKFKLTNRQLTFYTELVDKNMSNIYYAFKTEEKKDEMIYELIRVKFDKVHVYKYNEEREDFDKLTEIQLYTKIKARFANLRSVQIRRPSKKLKYTDQMKATFLPGAPWHDKPIPIPVPYTSMHYEKKNSFQSIYKDTKELKDWDDWHYYSMFHTLFQSFSTVVYSYSHKLADNEVVHRCTRTKINFPEYANCILVLHGRLVHSGSASKFENALSYNQSHDVRLFSYLSKVPTKSDKRQTEKNRRKSRRISLEMYTNHKEEGEVDTSTFKLCGEDCKVCKKQKSSKELNIEQILLHKQSKAGPFTKGQPRIVTGDLKDLGWAIYTGMDVNKSSYKIDLTTQIRRLVDKPKTNWYGINNTKRCAFKIDNLTINEPNAVETEYDTIFKLFDEIKTDVLHKIRPLGKKITLDKRALLANFGVVKEQKPHRDFSSVRTDDPNRIGKDS